MTISHLTAGVRFPLYGKRDLIQKGLIAFVFVCFWLYIPCFTFSSWATTCSSTKELLKVWTWSFFHITLSWSWNKEAAWSIEDMKVKSTILHHRPLKLNCGPSEAIPLLGKKAFFWYPSQTHTLFTTKGHI